MDNTTIAPRKWWVAGLLSLLANGLGQLYNGQVKKAIIYFMLPEIIFMICIIISLRQSFLLILGIIAVVAVKIFIIADAATFAVKRGGQYRLRRYNSPLIYIVIFLVFNVGIGRGYAYVVKKNVVQAYKIPAASMEPTLLVGDHILIDKFSGNSKSPDRGDIAVFVYPEDPSKDFIKRVVGLPGDTVEIRDKKLYINAEPYKEDYVIYSEENIIDRENGPRDNFGPVEIPEGSYFTLGDNRDRSFDSRYWGFVGQDKIHGVARVIYWSWDGNNLEARWDRIGTAIR